MNDWRWRWWQEVCAKEMQFYENEYGRRSLLSRRRNIIAFTHTTINARVVYIIIINIMKIQFVHAEEKWLKFVVHLSQGDQQSVSQTGLARRRRRRRRTATSGCVLGLLRVIQSRYLFASLGAFSPRDSRFYVVGTARCVYRFLGRGRQSFSQSVGQAKRVYGWSATTVSRGTTAGHYRGGGPRNWLIHIDWQVLLDDAVGFMLLHLCFGYCGTWRWHSFNIKQSINWLRREIYRYPETSCGGAFTSHVNHEWIESRHESKHADFYNRNSRIVLFVDLS